jgi:hypothetical protein
MPQIAKLTEITDEEAVALIRDHIAAQPPVTSEFRTNDAVRLDTGCIGVVDSVDPHEGTVTVYYLDEDGKIQGPAMGYDLEKLSL